MIYSHPMTGSPRHIDRKDRRILLELDGDSRRSYSSLAQRLRLPVETVRYRVQNLLERRLILNFFAVIDGGKLGFYYYKVFLKLHNVSEAHVAKVIEFLVSNETVNWVVRVEGSYDLGFTIRVPHPIALSAFIDDLRARYRTYLHSWILSINIKMDFLSRTYLLDRARKQMKIGAYSAHDSPYPLDRPDTLILAELARNSRAAAAEIARKTGLSDDSVLQRIQRMQKDKVIVRYGLVLNNEALGQVNYYVLIYLNKLSHERRESFFSYCTSKSNIVYIIKALGEWDFEISVEAASVDDYRELMMDLTTKYSDIIRDYNGMMVRTIHKYTYP